jgi:hypothetical protein
MSCNKTGLGGCVGGERWWSSQQRNQQAFINPAWESFPPPATTGPKTERSWKDVYAQVLLLLSSPLSVFSPPSAQQLQWRGRAISRPEESKQHKVTHTCTTSWEISLKKKKKKEMTHSLLDGEYWVLDGARAHKEQKPCTYYYYYYYYYYSRCRTAIPVQFLFFFSKTMYFITTTPTTTTTEGEDDGA